MYKYSLNIFTGGIYRCTKRLILRSRVPPRKRRPLDFALCLLRYRSSPTMTKKQSKKLAKSGQLKKTIQARHKHKAVQNRVRAKQQKKQGRQEEKGRGLGGRPSGNANGQTRAKAHGDDDDDEGEEDEAMLEARDAEVGSASEDEVCLSRYMPALGKLTLARHAELWLRRIRQ